MNNITFFLIFSFVSYVVLHNDLNISVKRSLIRAILLGFLVSVIRYIVRFMNSIKEGVEDADADADSDSDCVEDWTEIDTNEDIITEMNYKKKGDGTAGSARMPHRIFVNSPAEKTSGLILFQAGGSRQVWPYQMNGEWTDIKGLLDEHKVKLMKKCERIKLESTSTADESNTSSIF